MDRMTRLISIPDRPVQADLEKRILRGVVFVTRGIASDGGVVLPLGLRTDIFEKGGEILARHGMATPDPRPLNIGRPVGLEMSEREGVVEIEFADSELGREYAYIYGVNDTRTAYARGWSFGWDPVETTTWGLAQAQRELGADYDPDLVPDSVVRKRSVWVTVRGLLREVSATPRRADAKALTRAWEEGGIREAARLAHGLQMAEAGDLIATLREERDTDRRRIVALERDVAALRGAATPPAALGDGGDVVRELEALLAVVRKNAGC